VNRVLAGGVGGAAVLLASACGGGVPGVSAAKAAQVSITPVNGGTEARPDAPIKVTASHGTLAQVSVQPAGGVAAIGGSLDSGRTHWTSAGNLTPGAKYIVTATAKNSDGKVTTATSSFSTLTPSKTLSIVDVTPDQPGESVGVGAPIIVTFNRTVTNKAAVEKALTVTAEKPAEGAWRWVGGSQVIYRTKDYWQAHQKVTFTAHLVGVAAGTGMYGVKDMTKTIQIGSAQISVVNVSTGRMTVTRDGEKIRSFPISAGRATTTEYTTTNGVHLTMEKDNPVTMTSPGRKPGESGYYKVQENYAVRISNSGEFVHESDPTVPSHGCIHAATENAKWFYDIAQRGDIVKVTGTDRELPWDNGWGYWQMSFDQWKKGSALNA
jgi:lipoprotein-anchoring transpeptidase ErfK/SrfK